MKHNYAQIILKDKESCQTLKDMILEKSKRYDDLHEERERYLYYNDYEGRDKFGQWFLKEVFDQLLGGDEIRQIEHDLASMCFQLRRAEGRIPEHTEWDDQFEYATNQVKIGNVIRRYLQVDHFHRNIRCPFHEDRSPSFKVYEESNRFVCFGCNAHGSPIDFVMQYEKCSFKEAVSTLSNL